MNSKYWDVRSDFFRGYFEIALPYEQYIKSGSTEDINKWLAMQENIRPSPGQMEVVKSFQRKMNILVMSGIWCGDCVRQGPMLAAIEQANPNLSLRFIDNKENPELQEELRINGAMKVPVVVVLSEDFYELERFGDRHLSVYRRKLENELGPACDAGILPPSQEDLSQELEEWVGFFERLQIMLRLAPALRKKYND
jgi:thiol-disulfide isomerase/thioredoxin